MSFGKCLVSCGPFTVSYIIDLPIPKDNFYKVMLGNLLCDAGSSNLVCCDHLEVWDQV